MQRYASTFEEFMEISDNGVLITFQAAPVGFKPLLDYETQIVYSARLASKRRVSLVRGVKHIEPIERLRNGEYSSNQERIHQELHRLALARKAKIETLFGREAIVLS